MRKLLMDSLLVLAMSYSNSALATTDEIHPIVSDLSFKNIMREFYAGKMVNTFVNDEDITKYPYIGLVEQNTEKDERTIALMHPVINYQNTSDEPRYLVMIELVKIYDSGSLVTCHACTGNAELYSFKKLSNGQFQLISHSAKNAEFSGSWGRVSLDLEELKKNIQPFGKNLIGSYIQNGYSSTGTTETWWEAIHLPENDPISIYSIADAGSTNGGSHEENSPLYYGYDSTLKILNNNQQYFPIEIHYKGEKPDEDYENIKPVNYTDTYLFNHNKKAYELFKR